MVGTDVSASGGRSLFLEVDQPVVMGVGVGTYGWRRIPLCVILGWWHGERYMWRAGESMEPAAGCMVVVARTAIAIPVAMRPQGTARHIGAEREHPL